MPNDVNFGMCSARSKRPNSSVELKESWKLFYELDGDVIGRGGAGKVFRIKAGSGCILHKRKTSIPANLNDGEFGSNCEIINNIPADKSLAVKIIRRFRCGRDSINKIRNEINLLKRLQKHRPGEASQYVPDATAPYLVSVHEDATQVAIVMEYAKGGSLFDLYCLTFSAQSVAPSGDNSLRPSFVPEVYVSSVLARITDALVYMHERVNIVHLDIKAENILLREPYPSPNVFITDFGLASVLSQTKPHRELAGTPDYTAPEVISYDPVSFATDMWSVGVLAYFMLTGVSPFLAETKALTLSNITQMKIDYPSHLFDGKSAAAVDFIKALIARNPRARLTASQCTQHDWLRQQPELLPLVEEEQLEALSGSDSGGASSSDECSASSASPIRKRIALSHSLSSVSDQENMCIAAKSATSPAEAAKLTTSKDVTEPPKSTDAAVGAAVVFSEERGGDFVDNKGYDHSGCLSCMTLPTLSTTISPRRHQRSILCSIPAALVMTPPNESTPIISQID